MNIIKQQYDVVIIGAGHSGLCLSYLLTKSKVDHIILEKDEIGSTWISQRWDNFKLVTPNKFNILLPEDISYLSDSKFCTAKEFSAYLKEFALKKELPVFENQTVYSVSQNDEEYKFSLLVSCDAGTKNLKAKNVAVCSGYQNSRFIPPFANQLSKSVYQIHSSEYKNSKSLLEGAVLIVGSGQSGVQIAEELLLEKKTIFLCTSKVGRLPRNYLGKDIVELLQESGFYDIKREDISDNQTFTSPQPQLSGNVNGEDVSLSYLEKIGAILLGSVNSITANEVQLNDDLPSNISYANEFANRVEQLIDGKISSKKENCKAALPLKNLNVIPKFSRINLDKEKITTVIWATGFKPDYSFLKMDYKNPDESIAHQNGMSPIKGLYYLGIPWQRKRKSGIIMGVFEDAGEISKDIISNLSNNDISDL